METAAKATRLNTRKPFRKATVLGSGVMGVQIAAHLANAGLEVDLLDLPSEKGGRNSVAEKALKHAAKMNPSPFVTKKASERIKPGNFEDDFSRLTDTEWVIEAVVENLNIKQSLMEKAERHIGEHTIVTTNTSGLPIHQILEGRSDDFKSRFLGTHFFNPPRYLKLLELIPTSYTHEDIVEKIGWFGRIHLGKGIVRAKDTPNFIGNRVGVFALMHSLKEFEKGKYTIEEIDTLTGPLIGRQKSATFRTADVVGLDTLMYVADNLHNALDESDEARELFKTPPALKSLVDNGALGAKTKAGFYRKEGKEIKSINPETGEYESTKYGDLGDIDSIKKLPTLEEKWKSLYTLEGRGGDFIRNHIQDLFAYTINRIPEISDNPADVDRALCWGFGWQAGPFRIADWIGVPHLLDDIRKKGHPIPEWIQKMQQSGAGEFYKYEKREQYIYLPDIGYTIDPRPEDELSLNVIKAKAGSKLWSNEEAALLDLGEGVTLFEFRSKANTLSQNVMKGLFEALDKVEAGDFKGMVIGNDGANFSVGANLGELAHYVMEGQMKPVEQAVKRFQDAIQRVHYATKPVVAAPHSKTLGGACELAMGASRIVAPTETYIGLVEFGVGLIPAGCGTMRMAERSAKRAATSHASQIQPFLQQAFETLAMAKVATSAQQAKELGFLQPADNVVMHEDRRLYAAKHQVIAMFEQGYRPPAVQSEIRVLGKPGKAPLYTTAWQMQQGGFITEYELHLAERLAHILTGGELTGPATVHEDYLLELEREVFLSLLGQPKTQERVKAVLETNKPIRN